MKVQQLNSYHPDKTEKVSKVKRLHVHVLLFEGKLDSVFSIPSFRTEKQIGQLYIFCSVVVRFGVRFGHFCSVSVSVRPNRKNPCSVVH